jgi:hypothetical protein
MGELIRLLRFLPYNPAAVETSLFHFIDQNSDASWVRKLHFSNIPSVGPLNQCLCGFEAPILERVF